MLAIFDYSSASAIDISWKFLFACTPFLIAFLTAQAPYASTVLLQHSLDCTKNSLKLSALFSNGLVLQRGELTRVWGWASESCTVSVEIQSIGVGGNAVLAEVVHDGNGFWVATLPPQTASIHASGLVIQTNGGDLINLEIFFGEVLLCAGQSNIAGHPMDGSVGPADVAISLTVEPHKLRKSLETHSFPVRYLMLNKSSFWCVGEALSDLEFKPTFPWTDASLLSPHVEAFSGVCWSAGRSLAEELNGEVPVGMIEVAVGGSFIQAWSSHESNKACAAPEVPNDFITWAQGGKGGIRNGLIGPLLPGPITLGGVLWYNGESNSLAVQHAYYACALPALLSEWRSAFKKPDLWFGVVQLHPFFIYDTTREPTAFIRSLQTNLVGNGLNGVSVIPTVDLGDPLSPSGNLHPRFKFSIGKRIARAYAGAHLKSGPLFSGGPRYASARILQKTQRGLAAMNDNPCSWAVEVRFVEGSVGGGGLAIRGYSEESVATRCPIQEGVPAEFCESFSIQGSDGNWRNVTHVSLGEGGDTLILSLNVAPDGVECTPSFVSLRPVATRSGYTSWPVSTVSDLTELPAHPWGPSLIQSA